MAIFGSSYFDLITGTLGAYMYMIVWDVLKMSGLVFFAFVAVIGEALVQNYESDNVNDEPHQQLNRLSVRLIIMAFSIVFVAMPIVEIDSLKLRVATRQCEIIPTVTTSELRLSSEDWKILDRYGAGYLVSKLLEEKRQAGFRRYTGNQVAYDIFTGKLLSEYLKLEHATWGHNGENNLVQIIEKAKQNTSMSDAINDLGLSLNSLSSTIAVPVWWQMWRNYMLGVSAATIAKIPCDSGLRVAKDKFDMQFITDHTLKDNFLDFYQQCHAPAISRWKSVESQKQRGLVSALRQRESAVVVPGNLELLRGGYYAGIRSSIPVKGFGSVASEKGYSGNASAEGSTNPAVPSGTGYPTCDQWWLHPNKGLEEHLIGYFGLNTPEGVEMTQKLLKTSETNEKVLLQTILAKKLTGESLAAKQAASAIMQKVTGAYLATHEVTQESDHIGSKIMGWGVDLGLITSYFERMTGFKALLRAIPVATSFLIMFFMALIPVGLVVGRFSIGAILGLTVSYASFYLWVPYFRLVKWIDDNLISIFNLDALSTDKMMLDMLVGASYIAVPALLTSVVSMVGVRLASFDPIGASNIGSVGQGGAKTAVNWGKMLVTKGKNAAAGMSKVGKK